jgi:predicted dehydrogenase
MRELLDEGRIGEVKIGHAFDNVSVGGWYFFHNPHAQKAFYRSLLLQKACHSLDLLNWFMGSAPVRVYATGGQAFYGRLEDPSLRCRDCRKASTCPYFVRAKSVLDYGAAVETADYCVWSKEMDLDDHAVLSITYASGAKATFHECQFTPEYSREFWLVGTKGKMYGYYDNPGRFLVRIEYSHDARDRERRFEECRPPHTGGGHGGGDNRLRDEFYRRIVKNDPPTEAISSAYYSTALALCAAESIETGAVVNIPPPE